MENNIRPYSKTFIPRKSNIFLNNIENNYFNNNQFQTNNNFNPYNIPLNQMNRNQSQNFYPFPIYQTFINLPIYPYPFISLFPQNNTYLPNYSPYPIKQKEEEIKPNPINIELSKSIDIPKTINLVSKKKNNNINPFWRDEEPLKRKKLKDQEIWKNELIEQIKEKEKKDKNRKKYEEEYERLEEYKFEEYLKYKNKQNLEQEERRKKLMEERRAKLELEAMKQYYKNKNEEMNKNKNEEEDENKEENIEKEILKNENDEIRTKYLYQKVLNSHNLFQDLLNETFDKELDNSSIYKKNQLYSIYPFDTDIINIKSVIDKDKVYERIKTQNINQNIKIEKNKFEIPNFFENKNN